MNTGSIIVHVVPKLDRNGRIWMAQHLLLRPTENTFCFCIPPDDPALFIREDNRERRAREDGVNSRAAQSSPANVSRVGRHPPASQSAFVAKVRNRATRPGRKIRHICGSIRHHMTTPFADINRRSGPGGKAHQPTSGFSSQRRVDSTPNHRQPVTKRLKGALLHWKRNLSTFFIGSRWRVFVWFLSSRKNS